MRKLFLVLISLAFAPRLARAQDAQTAVVAERVTYSRAIPKGLRAFVPRGGKSRFWGATKLKYNGQQVWVHVYDVAKAKLSKDEEGRLLGTQKSALDLFTLSTLRVLRRISSNRFDYKRYDVVRRKFDSQLVGIETLWLDPKVQKMPIVRIILAGTQGYIAEDESVLVIFNKGFKNSILQQGFNSGASGGGASGGSWYTHFDQIDEDGLLKIVHNYSTYEGTDYTFYKWNGKQFVASGSEYVAREQ